MFPATRSEMMTLPKIIWPDLPEAVVHLYSGEKVTIPATDFNVMAHTVVKPSLREELPGFPELPVQNALVFDDEPWFTWTVSSGDFAEELCVPYELYAPPHKWLKSP
jgi:hypothetical protein